MNKMQMFLVASSSLLWNFTHAQEGPGGPRAIRVVHQDISKWDKNGDGKLTGAERDEFLKQKRKEAADAEAAARAAKLKAKSPKLNRAHPSLSPEDVEKPIAKGVPKNIEDAQQ